MRTLFILLVMSLWMSETAMAQQAASQEFSKLSWLEGKWERTNIKEGRTAFEVWKMQGLGFIGEGISMEGKDTVFVEKLSIRQKEGHIYYVAEVSENAEPTYFKITQITDNGFICEKPDHDFPKRIEYTLESNQTMKAIISGDGRSVPFVFYRID